MRLEIYVEKMKVEIFPSGGVHSMYLDTIQSPPEGVEYIGGFSHAPGSSIDSGYSRVGKYVLDKLRLPYFARPIYEDADFVHSSQKMLLTNKDYVIDVEHGNPFMGADIVNKTDYLHYRWLVSKFLNKDNCKYILPWTNTAMNAFNYNYGFLGRDLLEEKVRVVYPATKYVGKHHKTDTFTFTFVGGTTWDTFYSKGGIQVLQAAQMLDFAGFEFDLNFVSKYIPDYIDVGGDGLFVANGLPRDKLMEMFMYTDVVLLPSACDTFGMVLIEAMARGVPSIVSDSFAAKEVVGDAGVVIESDYNVNRWFDNNNLKIFGKGPFHDQFRYGEYCPSFEHVYDLANAMADMIEDASMLKMKSKECLREVKNGRFSIDTRNKLLRDVYF